MNLLTKRQLNQLEKLENLLSRWRVDWVLVDSYALRMQGFKVKERGHINVLVNKSKLIWMRKAIHEAFPPRHTKYFNEYFEFIENVAPLHLITYTPQQLKGIFQIYYLPNNKEIKIGEPSASVEAFGREIKQHNIKELGEEKIRQWLHKIARWQLLAHHQKDEQFEKSCQNTISQVKAHFNLS